jgi:hypothetical protein
MASQFFFTFLVEIQYGFMQKNLLFRKTASANRLVYILLNFLNFIYRQYCYQLYYSYFFCCFVGIKKIPLWSLFLIVQYLKILQLYHENSRFPPSFKFWSVSTIQKHWEEVKKCILHGFQDLEASLIFYPGNLSGPS